MATKTLLYEEPPLMAPEGYVKADDPSAGPYASNGNEVVEWNGQKWVGNRVVTGSGWSTDPFVSKLQGLKVSRGGYEMIYNKKQLRCLALRIRR